MAIVISGVNNNDKITASDGTIDLLSGVNYAGIITAPAFTTPGNLTAGHLNIGSGIQLGNAGIVTATTFVGNLTGNVNATSNLLLQISGSEKLRIANSGAFGLNGTNYGSSGQVLTSQGSGSSPVWSTIASTTLKDSGNNTRVSATLTGAVVSGILTATASMNVKQSGNAYLNLLSTGTGNAGIYMDASNGDIAGSDYCSIYQKNDLDLAITNRKNTASIIFETGGENERLRITSSGQLILNSTSATDAQFTVVGSGHYVVTSGGRAHKHIHCRAVNGNSGEYGGAISFGMGSDGSSAIAAEQMGSDGNVNGLAFFTHPTSTGSDDSVKRMKITSTGGIQLNNYGSTRGFIFQRLGAGTYPDFPNVQGSQGRGMCSGQRVIAANTATEIAKSHWGGLALVGYSNGQHQGTAQVMFGYGGAGASVRFNGYWVRQESITISFTVSAYSLMISHNASNDLTVWCILIGV